jgi:hypothetical protein
MKIFWVYFPSIFFVFFYKQICTFFAFFASADRRSRYIRYRDNIGDNQYGESYKLVINNTPQKTYRVAQYSDSWNRFHSLSVKHTRMVKEAMG